MAQFCPIYNRNVVYLDCLECDTKECRNHKNKISIDAETEDNLPHSDFDNSTNLKNLKNFQKKT